MSRPPKHSLLSRAARRLALLLGLAAIGATPACYGPFAATRRVWHWNRQFEDEWTREAVFLATGVLTPVYVVCSLGDMLLFNSAWFWTGDGWIDEPGGDHHLQALELRLQDPALDGLSVGLVAGLVKSRECAAE